MATKEYDHAGRAGCVSLSRSRLTGCMVGIYETEQAGLDPSVGKWIVVCEEHSRMMGYDSLALTRRDKPAEWCDECREKIAAR